MVDNNTRISSINEKFIIKDFGEGRLLCTLPVDNYAILVLNEFQEDVYGHIASLFKEEVETLKAINKVLDEPAIEKEEIVRRVNKRLEDVSYSIGDVIVDNEYNVKDGKWEDEDGTIRRVFSIAQVEEMPAEETEHIIVKLKEGGDDEEDEEDYSPFIPPKMDLKATLFSSFMTIANNKGYHITKGHDGIVIDKITLQPDGRIYYWSSEKDYDVFLCWDEEGRQVTGNVMFNLVGCYNPNDVEKLKYWNDDK